MISSIIINETSNNIFEPSISVLPERLRSISIPLDYTLLREDFNSTTDVIKIN